MVKIGLKLKASLTNVLELYPQDPEQFCWPLKVRCTGCGEVDQNWHLVSQSEVVELPNAEAHFLYKCKCCSRQNYLSILPSNYVNSKHKGDNRKCSFETVYRSSDHEKYKTIIGFDCRGLELTEFEPRGGWEVKTEKKTFFDVDLSDKEWVEYDNIACEPVEIMNMEHEFVTIK